MSEKIEIELTTPIVGHSGPITKVVLRAPLAGDFFLLGEPFAYAASKEGLVYSAENAEVVRGYIERLLIEPNALLLANVSLKDAMRIKAVLMDFFSDARPPSLKTGAIS